MKDTGEDFSDDEFEIERNTLLDIIYELVKHDVRFISITQLVHYMKRKIILKHLLEMAVKINMNLFLAVMEYIQLLGKSGSETSLNFCIL